MRKHQILAAAALCLILASCYDSERNLEKPKDESHSTEIASASHQAVATTGRVLDDPDIAVSDIAGGYKAFRRMTPEKGVGVNWELSMLCRGVEEFDVKLAQKKDGVHAHSAISIYMNPPAATAFEGRKNTYPPGSVIIKEKVFGAYQKSMSAHERVQPNDGVGGMINRAPGFDPDHGDWEYFYFENPATIEAGRISSCVTCHAGAAETDHVFGSWAIYRR